MTNAPRFGTPLPETTRPGCPECQGALACVRQSGQGGWWSVCNKLCGYAAPLPMDVQLRLEGGIVPLPGF